MSRLPKVGSDDNTWGDLLNDFLLREHGVDGSLRLRTDGTLAALDTIANKVDTADPRLSNARTPTSHAGSHAPGGADPITAALLNAAPATALYFSTYNPTNDGTGDNTARFSQALDDANATGKVLYIDTPGTYTMSAIAKTYAPRIISVPGVTIK